MVGVLSRGAKRCRLGIRGKTAKKCPDYAFACRGTRLVRLIGIEPTHPAPEAGALSTELQAHMKSLGLVYHTFSKKQSNF